MHTPEVLSLKPSGTLSGLWTRSIWCLFKGKACITKSAPTFLRCTCGSAISCCTDLPKGARFLWARCWSCLPLTARSAKATVRLCVNYAIQCGKDPQLRSVRRFVDSAAVPFQLDQELFVKNLKSAPKRIATSFGSSARFSRKRSSPRSSLCGEDGSHHRAAETLQRHQGFCCGRYREEIRFRNCRSADRASGPDRHNDTSIRNVHSLSTCCRSRQNKMTSWSIPSCVSPCFVVSLQWSEATTCCLGWHFPQDANEVVQDIPQREGGETSVEASFVLTRSAPLVARDATRQREFVEAQLHIILQTPSAP